MVRAKTIQAVLTVFRGELSHRTQKWNPLLGWIRCALHSLAHRLARKTGSTFPHDALEGFPASLLLHAFFALALSSLLLPKIIPPTEEGIPVEIWSPEEWEIVRKPPAPMPESAFPESREAAPRNPGPIRTTRMLSDAALAHPGSRSMRQALGRMEEETRLEQLCDIEAMAQIAAHLEDFQPDRLVAYAKAEVKLAGNMLVADGAAFRSRQKWYDLKFKCELGKDRQAVQGFEFSVGSTIPKRDWEAYNLPSPALDTD